MDIQTLEAIADLICGDIEGMPLYRKGYEITKFFSAAGVPRQHDGSTRRRWTLETLSTCTGPELTKIVLRLASPREYRGDADQTRKSIEFLNRLLILEGRKIILEGVEPKLVSAEAKFDLKPQEPKEPELKPLPAPNFALLNLDFGIDELLKNRWVEAQVCVDKQAYLAATILMGSLLEGMLLGVMQRKPREANQASNAPKDNKTGAVKPFSAWTLSEMIDVAHSLGWINLNVKKFSHALRDFRNLVHPYMQLATQAKPDIDTCKISWLVVQAAVSQLATVLSPNAAKP